MTGRPSGDFHQPQRSTLTASGVLQSASGVLRLPAEYFDCQRSTSTASVVLQSASVVFGIFKPTY